MQHIASRGKRTEPLTETGAAFLQGLLTSDENERIGHGTAGFAQVVRHPWLDDVNWEAMLRRRK